MPAKALNRTAPRNGASGLAAPSGAACEDAYVPRQMAPSAKIYSEASPEIALVLDELAATRAKLDQMRAAQAAQTDLLADLVSEIAALREARPTTDAPAHMRELFDDHAYSVAEARSFIGLEKSALNELLNEGKIAFIRNGQRRRAILGREIRAYQEAGGLPVQMREPVATSMGTVRAAKRRQTKAARLLDSL